MFPTGKTKSSSLRGGALSGPSARGLSGGLDARAGGAGALTVGATVGGPTKIAVPAVAPNIGSSRSLGLGAAALGSSVRGGALHAQQVLSRGKASRGQHGGKMKTGSGRGVIAPIVGATAVPSMVEKDVGSPPIAAVVMSETSEFPQRIMSGMDDQPH